jgi:hypothetical protein
MKVHLYSLCLWHVSDVSIDQTSSRCGSCFCRKVEVPQSSFMGDIRADGQGPPPQMVERFQGVISQLFQHVSRPASDASGQW